MAHKLENGKWVLYRGEAQWLAWREWWLGAFQRRFWPERSEKTAMLSEWPPETYEAAAAVSDYWRSVDENAKPGASGKSWDAPANPAPWRRWDAFEQAERIESYRKEQSMEGGLGPKDAARIDQIMKIFNAPKRQKPPKLDVPGPQLRVVANPKPVRRDYDLAALAAAKPTRDEPVSD